MTNEEKDEQLYKYPRSNVLRNKLDIRDSDELDKIERLFVAQRSREVVLRGKFDLDHLRAIHRHLFQDIYEWAGEIRRVDFHKGGLWFLPQDRIETGLADIHHRLTEQNFLRDLNAEDFSERAGVILGDINFAHPFREGNGRTQLQYLKQLAVQAGHKLDLRKIDPKQWIEASIEANRSRYEPMSAYIEGAITGLVRERSAPRARDRGRGGQER